MNKELYTGWPGIEVADKAFSKMEKEFIKFSIKGGPSTAGPPIWRYYKRVNKGNNLETFYQETGDCTSAGAKHVLEYTAVADKLIYKKPVEIKRVFSPYIYGVSRTASDCGNGQLGRSGGATGAWAAAAVKNHGVLFCDDAGVPKYSGKLADKWGYSGVPDEFYKLASDNLVKSTARIETVSELREALINYHFATIASSWAYKVSQKEGVKIYIHDPSTSWMHQMCFIAWRDYPFPAAFQLNSWGDSTGPSLEGEPLGGAWVQEETLRQLLKTGVELYVYSSFDGFPAVEPSAYSFV